MNYLQAILTAIAVFVILVSLLNEGGTILALVIAAIVIILAVTIPFVKEYVLAASKGKWGEKTSQDREARER
jgi:uncharacterized membrane protein